MLRILGTAILCAMVALHTGAVAQTGGDEGADVAKAPEAGGPRRWRVVGGAVSLYDAPSPDAARIEPLAEGAVLANLGCVLIEGQGWCEVQPFRGGASGFTPFERLQPAQGPDGAVPTGVDDSNRRANRRDFDAEGVIACAQEQGQELGECAVGVARSGGGDATVVAIFPNGFARKLYFTHGEFIKANATMSGGGRDTDWRMAAGRYFVRVDDQRYEIPTALVLGE